MTDPKPKKPEVPTRTPQKKTKAGIFDNLRQLPHPVEEFLQLGPTHPNPSQPVPTQPSPTQPKPAQTAKNGVIAPARDFNRRANSLEREALPQGLFPGTSKKLYDALYLRTRGALVPVRTVQATKRQLMEWSGIRSKNTIAVNLQLLEAGGLVVRNLEIGDHDGSVYEILLPEETRGRPDPTQPNPAQPSPTQKLGGDPTQKSGWVGSGNPVENKEGYGVPKTSFKTDTERSDDDEAFRQLVATFKQANREVTGKEPSPAEAARWNEIGEVLVTELKIAAGRTTVSSVPAFLAEHLRRRLFKKDKREIEREAAAPEAEKSPALTKEQIDQCRDCFGTGMWYPEGYEKGVAKCRHEKLAVHE